MKKIEIILNNKSGLHARPASLFVQCTQKYESDIKIINDNKDYDAKSIMSILSIGAVQGTKIEIIAQGIDEEKAIIELEKLSNNNFGE